MAPITLYATGRAGIGLMVVLLAIVAAAAAWWYFVPGSLPAALKALVPASPKAIPTLYKWRDAKGRLNVTDTPPTDRPYETLKYNPDTNVVPNVMPPATQPAHD